MNKKKTLTIRNMVLMALFIALLYLSAIIQIPLPFDDYFTLQFVVVLLIGFMLGSKLGSLTVFLYVALGTLGIPWFASGGGLGYLQRGSYGFIVGFIFTTFAVGFLSEKVSNLNYLKCLLIGVVGLVICYFFGSLHKYLLFNFYLDGTNHTSLWAIVLASLSFEIPCDVVKVCVCAKLGLALRTKYQEIEESPKDPSKP